MGRHLRDIDVLAAAVDSARGRERRRVIADERYAFRHARAAAKAVPQARSGEARVRRASACA
jgi:hypothetical protein